jgi:hypothetical protein|tara:strand:- start:460 stop:708 length:249 start_codon:yes stop_codon:yes gene_type:complete
MINNPAKAVYIKFDTMASMIEMDSEPAPKETTTKGLLQRISNKDFTEKEGQQQEPLDVAMDYFIAIRQARKAIKETENQENV